MNALTEAVLAIAAGQIGVRELGRNRGPRVEEYQRAAGAHPGDPWCASFVVWCFLRAGEETGMSCPLPITPGAMKLWRKSDPWMHWNMPSAGSIFVLDHGGGLGHCGLVEAFTPDGRLLTIEGNTGPGITVAAKDREGDGVYRRHDRTVSDPSLVGFVDVSRMPGAIPEDIT